MAAAPREPNWKALTRSWDAQQEHFLPERERRFRGMFEVLDALAQGESISTRFTVLDLGCGPGALSVRLLRRFPRAHTVGVDFDPVVLRIARGAHGSVGGRATWVDANLRRPEWRKALPKQRYDAALSTTALHWLEPPQLARLYRDLYRILPRGGVFVNGDAMRVDPRDRTWERLYRTIRRRRAHRTEAEEWSPWKKWWKAVEKERYLAPEFALRKQRFAVHPHGRMSTYPFHVRSLRRAGFRFVGTVWQDLEDHILVAIK
jgi:SAM-dependent methyltransferase